MALPLTCPPFLATPRKLAFTAFWTTLPPGRTSPSVDCFLEDCHARPSVRPQSEAQGERCADHLTPATTCYGQDLIVTRMTSGVTGNCAGWSGQVASERFSGTTKWGWRRNCVTNPEFKRLFGVSTPCGIAWCRRVESNHRPKAYESFALPLSYVGATGLNLHVRPLPRQMSAQAASISDSRLLGRRRQSRRISVLR